jgi:putative transposase
MPRHSRIVIPKIPHHITQRGNYRQNVFEHDEDYVQYCTWMNQYSQKYGVDILAYCLMINHIHFVVVPHDEESLARVFNTIHMRYAQHVHRRRGARGHLWQGRFFSCFMDSDHLCHAIRYVERNPVRAGMATVAWDYRWSSAGVHAGLQDADKGPIAVDIKNFPMDKPEWREYLHAENEQIVNELRLKTQRGLALGGERFIKRLEGKLDRSLACLNPGRPRKHIQ